MVRLLQTVQARKILAFAPELKVLSPYRRAKDLQVGGREVKKPKKITQKKGVPRFLTRGIILKLKKKRSTNNTFAFTSAVFTFYRNGNKNRSKKKATEEVANSLVFSPKVWQVLPFGGRYNKNLNSLKKHKPIGDYIINTKPILQKKRKLIGIFYNTFFKIKPFFNVLQKFTGLLLKNNIYLIREAYPFIYAALKGASTIGGFKKVLYNKILVHDRRLKPTYNRRKHNTSHYMVVQNQFARLDKAFVYLGKNKLASMVGLALKTAYSRFLPDLSRVKTGKHNRLNNKRSIHTKTIPSLVSIIEGQVTLLLWRNQFNSSLTKSRQDHRQGVSQNVNVVCKNNTAILFKELVYTKPIIPKPIEASFLTSKRYRNNKKRDGSSS